MEAVAGLGTDAGAVATGALAAREADRADGGGPADRHHFTDAACRNCGTALAGPHCHGCGQAAHLHRDIAGFAHDVVHGVFHFDGKFWRTLPLLAWRPGDLTRRYIDGERQRFVTPMAMFLFSVFLMFAVASNVPGLLPTGDRETARADLNGAQREIAKGVRSADDRIARLQARRTAQAGDAEAVAKIDGQLTETRQRRQALVTAARFMPGADVSPKVRVQAAGQSDAQEKMVENWLEAKLEHFRENPKLFVYKMKTAGYKYSWALIPLSLPFLWLMFAWRRQFGLYDHAVFATYSLSAMSLLMVTATLVASLGGAGRTIAWLAVFAVPPLHMYRQLRGGYRLRRASALWRTVVLLHVVSFTSLTFFLWLVWLGLAS